MRAVRNEVITLGRAEVTVCQVAVCTIPGRGKTSRDIGISKNLLNVTENY